MTKRFSVPRLLNALVLGAWATLFWILMLTGRTSLYLAARVDWLVEVGAIGFTLLALGRLLTARAYGVQRAGPRDAARLGLVALPVVLTLALPTPSLGSFAVSRRTVAAGGFVAAPEDISSGDLSLVDVAGATRDREAMRTLTRRAGDEVSFVGFVTHDSNQGADEFFLNRFLVVCHVGDALNVQVRVVGAPPGTVKADDWVHVSGKLYPLGREVIVDADDVEVIDKPKRPYLYP